ncbi:MAG: exodeoxyribonuclease VII large subunit [Acidiferrobacterales bacterium]
MNDPLRPTEQPRPVHDIYSVSRLNGTAKQILEQGFPPFVWVEGEVSNVARPASGHIYFSLKDDRAQVRCALFRPQLRSLDSVPQNGIQVLVRARVSLYEGRGEFQLIVEHLEEAGEGALRRALDALKRRLGEEGLFDIAHKKKLPRLPRRIGLITSPSGAVVHDIVITLRRRFPAIPVLLYPIPVQGEDVAPRIAAAIRLASQRQDCDALILARGGGSLEDLWAFNEEPVARALFECRIPIVCGVGHETDVTIADLVADVRAPTPTAAAELLSPDQREWRGYFEQKAARLERLIQDAVSARQQKLDWLTARLVHPKQRIALSLERLANLERQLQSALMARLGMASNRCLELSARLDRLSPQARIDALGIRFEHCIGRLLAAMRHALERQQQRLRRAAQSLNNLSPLSTLERGYAIVEKSATKQIIRNAHDVRTGEHVDARLAYGRLHCVVKDVLEDD